MGKKKLSLIHPTLGPTVSVLEGFHCTSFDLFDNNNNQNNE